MNRRQFMQCAAVASAGISLSASASQNKRLNAAIIGCGVRGTGAVFNLLNADNNIKLTAMADIFEEKIVTSYKRIRQTFPQNVAIGRKDLYTGLDAWQKIMARVDIDIVILATPAFFRPLHLQEAIRAGKHVFAETPWAVDAPGLRICQNAIESAEKQGLTLISGLHHRHSTAEQEFFARIHANGIGQINSMQARQHFRAPQVLDRDATDSDIKWMLKNWGEFNWLGGDSLVNDSILALDRFSWALSNKTPLTATATGGRQISNNSTGNVFDHCAIEYNFPNDIDLHFNLRREENLPTSSKEIVKASHGKARLDSGRIQDRNNRVLWAAPHQPLSVYDLSMRSFIRSIKNGNGLNDGGVVMNANLMALMGREAAYSGKVVHAEQYRNSTGKLGPKEAFSLESSFSATKIATPRF